MADRQGYSVAVVGATGAVGQEMLKVLAERSFPVRELRALASARSARTRSISWPTAPVAPTTATEYPF